MRRITGVLALGVSLAALGCTDQARNPTLAVPADARPTLSDAARGGTAGFYFLSPMVPEPTTSGTFDPDLYPTVSICALRNRQCVAPVAEYTRTSGTDAERIQLSTSPAYYLVNWDTRKYAVSAADTFRIGVSVGSTALGFADVVVAANSGAAKNINTNEYIALVNGRVLGIKFRIETGIPAEIAVSPAVASVDVGFTQQFTATIRDLHGAVLEGRPVTWSSSTPSVAVSATGSALGLGGGVATVTATSGRLSASATLTAVTRVWSPASTNTQGNAGVWGASASDVYLANWVGIWHFDGSAWSSVPELQWHATLDVYGFGADDVWAVGPSGRILRYDGQGWSGERFDGTSVYSEPLGVWTGPALNVYLRGVWGSGPSDVFVVGDGGTVLHWDGAAWTKMATGTTAELHRVWGSSGSDVYVSGAGGMLLHYDGSAWSRVSVPTTVALERIWGSSAGDVYVGGANATLLHYDGSAWSQVVVPVDPSYTVYAVWGTSADNVYIAGTGGFVLRWDGAHWLREESGRSDQILGLWGSNGSDVFASMAGGWVTRRPES